MSLVFVRFPPRTSNYNLVEIQFFLIGLNRLEQICAGHFKRSFCKHRYFWTLPNRLKFPAENLPSPNYIQNCQYFPVFVNSHKWLELIQLQCLEGWNLKSSYKPTFPRIHNSKCTKSFSKYSFIVIFHNLKIHSK